VEEEAATASAKTVSISHRGLAEYGFLIEEAGNVIAEPVVATRPEGLPDGFAIVSLTLENGAVDANTFVLGTLDDLGGAVYLATTDLAGLATYPGSLTCVVPLSSSVLVGDTWLTGYWSIAGGSASVYLRSITSVSLV